MDDSSLRQLGGVTSCQLITDDGSENYGPVSAITSSDLPPIIEHLIAQQDIEFSNSMIEAVNKQLQYRFLYHRSIPDFAALQKIILQAIEDYNNRPHAALNGLTPLEVLHGKRYDKATYHQQVNAARAHRIAQNKRTSCGSYTF
ncbi:integrase core domain-containing protein [Paraflavitalea speifideaquila]|uniref:integrase core domain-containing protein n=1 Tax=Paraflavitalea speifideaquila TaxID=3076558 RepID=UPI0028EBBEAE|nr:integrase core domain-containing protein [Paraflavitalea speifideiaquila]